MRGLYSGRDNNTPEDEQEYQVVMADTNISKQSDLY